MVLERSGDVHEQLHSNAKLLGPSRDWFHTRCNTEALDD
jgi:hypothetical protein